jgi:hypothetical protein
MRGARIGFVFQSFNLINQLNVIENIGVPMYCQGRSERQIAQRAKELGEMLFKKYHEEGRLCRCRPQGVAAAGGKNAGHVQCSTGGYRWHLTAGWWDRHHEHHARHDDQAHLRNRHPKGDDILLPEKPATN